MSAALARVSRGQLLIGAGALLIILGELVFGVLADEYFIGQFPWAIAALAVILVGMGMTGRVLPNWAEMVLVLVGLTMAVLGVRDLLFDLRSLSNYGAVDYLAMVAYYGGIALMAAGAWMIWRKSPA
jgi:hypothetical protein